MNAFWWFTTSFRARMEEGKKYPTDQPTHLSFIPLQKVNFDILHFTVSVTGKNAARSSNKVFFPSPSIT